MATTLQRELDTFRRELPGLLAVEGNRGKYVLISGDTVAGVYPTFEAGVEAGYDRFGLEQFMVKEVTDHEVPRYFSRNVACTWPMPLIDASLDRHGAVIDLLVGVGLPGRTALEQQGLSVPPPVAVRTQIDTGSSVTGFAPRVFTDLGLRPVGTTPILTPSTPHDAPIHCREYFVSLAVVAGGRPYPFVEALRVIAAGGWAPDDEVQGLIGRDVLAHCTFMYFGTEGRFQFAV